MKANEVHVFVQKNQKDNKAVLKKLASRWTDKELILAQDSFGKPYFQNFKKLQFSISHSKNRLVIAFSWSSSIGVDIEFVKFRHYQKLAERIATAEEIKSFASSKRKKQDFYKLWTKKEAISKVSGQGFRMGFRNIRTHQWPHKTKILGSYVLTVATRNPKTKFKIHSSV